MRVGGEGLGGSSIDGAVRARIHELSGGDDPILPLYGHLLELVESHGITDPGGLDELLAPALAAVDGMERLPRGGKPEALLRELGYVVM